jgi:hypothetical protein
MLTWGPREWPRRRWADFSQMTASRERWSTWPRSASSEQGPELRVACGTAGQNPFAIAGTQVLAVRREPEFLATKGGRQTPRPRGKAAVGARYPIGPPLSH